MRVFRPDNSFAQSTLLPGDYHLLVWPGDNAPVTSAEISDWLESRWPGGGTDLRPGVWKLGESYIISAQSASATPAAVSFFHALDCRPGDYHIRLGRMSEHHRIGPRGKISLYLPISSARRDDSSKHCFHLDLEESAPLAELLPRRRRSVRPMNLSRIFPFRTFPRHRTPSRIALVSAAILGGLIIGLIVTAPALIAGKSRRDAASAAFINPSAAATPQQALFENCTTASDLPDYLLDLLRFCDTQAGEGTEAACIQFLRISDNLLELGITGAGRFGPATGLIRKYGASTNSGDMFAAELEGYSAADSTDTIVNLAWDLPPVIPEREDRDSGQRFAARLAAFLNREGVSQVELRKIPLGIQLSVTLSPEALADFIVQDLIGSADINVFALSRPKIPPRTGLLLTLDISTSADELPGTPTRTAEIENAGTRSEIAADIMQKTLPRFPADTAPDGNEIPALIRRVFRIDYPEGKPGNPIYNSGSASAPDAGDNNRTLTTLPDFILSGIIRGPGRSAVCVKDLKRRDSLFLNEGETRRELHFLGIEDGIPLFERGGTRGSLEVSDEKY